SLRSGSASLRDLEMPTILRPLTLLTFMKGYFARDCFSKTSEPSYKSPPSYSSSVSKGFQGKFTPKLIQSSQHAQSSQAEPKAQKDYKTEYKKLKAKLALIEASPPTSQSSKPFQPKNKGLVAKTFDWNEEELLDDEEETRVKVLMALANDELSVEKNHARNCEWIDITMKKAGTKGLSLVSFLDDESVSCSPLRVFFFWSVSAH
nr:retrovirus-related Pol polyprotein from transposon TNT 1-94 [Tanacetum cinerariifolium]